MLFWHFLWQKRRTFLCLMLFFVIFFVSFLLYDLPLAAVLYPTALCLAVGLLFLAADFIRFFKRHRLLSAFPVSPDFPADRLPAPQSVEETDYQALLFRLSEENRKLLSDAERSLHDMMDYYTLWVHQIKTPIAAMRLQLQSEDTPAARAQLSELFRIEQYVEMVLTYLRLDSDATDYCFSACELDSILRRSLRKYAGEFIHRKLTLKFTPTGMLVITDEKWLAFVVEQLLSNALKYTPAGGEIRIYKEEPLTLCIEDTGIGIAPEDLPRIFEKGYTGQNGRCDLRASGIGLYLCRRICKNLGVDIRAESHPEQGTVIRLNLSQKKFLLE